MPDYSNNFNNLNMALVSNKTGSRSSFGVGGASLNFANSAISLGGNVQSIAASVNDLFSAERDVINQNMNLMRGNHYISGYERVPVPPLPPISPFSPPNELANYLPPVANDVLGLSQDIRNQPLVEYDMENFKYTLDKSKDNSDFYYEDPLYMSFDLIFDRTVSPLFNGEIIKFFEVYSTNDYMYRAWVNYNKFCELFFKIFNGIGPQKYTTSPAGTQLLNGLFGTQFWNNFGSQDIKRNKVWYINSIGGLDKITAKIPKYEEDKITITLSEDIAMLVQYMVDCYNNFAYNYTEQRYNLPDNLMRFKMMIRLSDMRTMKLNNHFEIPEYMYDKATEIYTLYDCNFDFFNSKNFTDEVINGGFGSTSQNTPATVKFDITYKSIQKEFRTPLIKGEKGNVVDNKEIEGSKSLTDVFRDKLGRTQEEELSMKDILSGAFGALTSLNNMLTNYIPKFQPPLPILPFDIMGSVYDNNVNTSIGSTNSLQDSGISQDEPLLARKELINRFTEEMIGYNERIIPRNGRSTPLGNDYEQLLTAPRQTPLGEDYEQITTSPRQTPLGQVYTNDGIPTHGDLGFISLFLKPPHTGTLGTLYQNLGYIFNDNLGFDYTNVGYTFNGDLGFDYTNDGTPTHGDLGTDFTNTGSRPILNDTVLFGKSLTTIPPLGSLYTNLSELREVTLNTLYDNTVGREQISLGDLYNNLAEKLTSDLGTEFNNNVNKQVTSDLTNVYTNQTVERNVNLNELYGKTEKVVTQDMGSDFINTGERLTQDMGLVFGGTEKPVIRNLGSDFTNDGQRTTPDLGTDFTNDGQRTTPDLGTDFTNDGQRTTQDMGSVFNNSEQLRNISLDSVYNNVVETNKTDLNLLYTNEVNKTGELNNDDIVYLNQESKNNPDLGSDYTNVVLSKQGLDGESVYLEPLEKSKEDLGKDYENNLIDE